MNKFFMSLVALVAVTGFSTASIAHDEASAKGQEEAKFLNTMSEHHKDGIQMAKMATEKAQSKDVKSLAQKISSEQTAELKKMQSWESTWYPQVDAKMEMQKMDMSKLEQAQGSEFDREFLDMMTEHHKQAIDMTKNALSDLQHKENRKMAEKSLKTQATEVAKMEKLKSSIQ
jgi:uncharacterized protein (DUF305 family)